MKEKEYITEEKKVETRLELLTDVVAYGFERCASLNTDSGLVTILHTRQKENQEGLEITSYLDVNKKYATKIHPDDREFYLQECSLENIKKRLQTESHFEIIHRTVEGETVHYKKDQCYRSPNQRNICLLIRSDVTDVVTKEQIKQQQLQQALDGAKAATQAKSEFLSRMSHEIRTPMNAIMGMTAIARDNQSDFLQVSECLSKIDMSSHYLLTLINDILEMSRIESGRTEIKREPFDFYNLIDSIRTVVEPLALKGDIRFEFVNHVEAQSQYLGDMTRIQQIMVNLITNAIKFTKPNGRVRFCIDLEDKKDREVCFRFVVADTGIGMSEEFMERMFQPFVQEDATNTSEFGGSGLGLAISKSLLDAMNGKIEVESFQGIGTTFTVLLPLERYSASPANTGVEKVARNDKIDLGCLHGAQILIAEDHPLNVMVAKKLLEAKGIHVTVADNGKIAVEKFMGSPYNFYDVILMDIRMPLMDGLDAAKNIRGLKREDAKTVPIIAMTANALDEDRRQTKEAGMNDHLAKPFEPEKLYNVLAEYITKKGER